LIFFFFFFFLFSFVAPPPAAAAVAVVVIHPPFQASRISILSSFDGSTLFLFPLTLFLALPPTTCTRMIERD
jgi:hypothetical protein